jgi:hypothetical protein
MLNTAKNVMHSIGGGAMRVGEGSADLAKRVGSGTADLAKRVGMKRGLIGLAILGAAAGTTIYVVRYLRARRLAFDDVASSPEAQVSQRNHKSQKHQQHAHGAH